jgi:predicted nucleotidyltransferase
MKFGLKDTAINQIVNVFSSIPQIEEAIIFGSRAIGTYKPFSDIDITLKGDKITHKELNYVIMALDDTTLPYTFDISLYKQIDNPDLIEHIKRVGKLLYSKSEKAPK